MSEPIQDPLIAEAPVEETPVEAGTGPTPTEVETVESDRSSEVMASNILILLTSLSMIIYSATTQFMWNGNTERKAMLEIAKNSIWVGMDLWGIADMVKNFGVLTIASVSFTLQLLSMFGILNEFTVTWFT